MSKTLIPESEMIDEMSQVVIDGGNIQPRTGRENVWVASKKTANPGTAVYESSTVTARIVLEETRIVLTSEVVEGSKRFLTGENLAYVNRIDPTGPPISMDVKGTLTPTLAMNMLVIGGGGRKTILWVSLKDKSELQDILYGLLRVAYKSDTASDINSD